MQDLDHQQYHGCSTAFLGALKGTNRVCDGFVPEPEAVNEYGLRC